MPVGLAYSPGSDRVYANCYYANQVNYLNAAANTSEGTLDLPGANGPHIGVAVNPNTGRVYVANRANGTLSVIQDVAMATPTPTPTPTPLPCTADAYEPDNTAAEARPILPVSGYTQTHTFCLGVSPWFLDDDWVYFSVSASVTNPVPITITTANLSSGVDTFLSLFGPGQPVSTTLALAKDDDSGGGLASRIVYTVTTTGWYYVHVNNLGPAAMAAKGVMQSLNAPATSGRQYDLAVEGVALSSQLYLPLVLR